MKTYDTLSEAVNDLQKRGYTLDFNLIEAGVHCAEQKIHIHPEHFHIDEVYRFEGITDPGDENIIYAIASKKYQLKGILVSAFGTYDDGLSAVMLSKLQYR